MARQPHKPTPETRAQVEALCGYGITEDEISTYIGIAPKTLRKHYRHELDTAVVKANALVARSLHGQATGGNVAAAIFWLKVRAGWSEKRPEDNDNRPNVVIIHGGIPDDRTSN